MLKNKSNIQKNTPSYFAVVLAGGGGRRFKDSKNNASQTHGHDDLPKQYEMLVGKTVLERSVQTVCSAVFPELCVVTHSKNDAHIRHMSFSWATELVEGGAERMDSVLNALYMLEPHAQDSDFVLVHDGARPCVQKSDILKLMEQTKDHAVGGLLAIPVTDTIKQVDTGLAVEKTLARDVLWAAQTPQIFRFGLLLDALAKAKKNALNVTDDASALELSGYKPLIVKGGQTNIKITYAQDLTLARMIINAAI